VHVVVLASRKGGAGKTTLSSHLAVEAERAGAGRVALADTDPQGGLAAWYNARAAQTPLFVDVSQGLPAAIEACRRGGIDILFVDTPPSVTETIAAVGGTVSLVGRARKPLVFVCNQVTPRARITAEAAIALSQHGTVAPSMIASRVDFATSMTDGRTAVELDPSSKSAAEIAALWTYLAERMSLNGVAANG